MSNNYYNKENRNSVNDNNDSSLLRKIICEEISKCQDIICFNRCCEPYNAKITCCPPTTRCQIISQVNPKNIFSLNYEPVPVPICFIECSQSSSAVSTSTQQQQPIVGKQEPIGTDVECQTDIIGSPSKESCLSVASDPKIIPDCDETTALHCPCAPLANYPRKVCAICCCPVGELGNCYPENVQICHKQSRPQMCCYSWGENTQTCCINQGLPLPTQCMCSPPNKRTSSEKSMKEFGSKPQEISPKRQLTSDETHFKTQSNHAESDVKKNGEYFTINGKTFKSCQCGDNEKRRPLTNDSVKQPFTNEVASVNDQIIPSTSDSQSSIDSQSSYRKRLNSHLSWSKKTEEFSKTPPKEARSRESSKNRNKKNQGTFTLWIESMSFSSYTIDRLNGMDSNPYVYLTWTFLELQDKAYSTIMPANKAIFNCSSVYRGDITIEMLHYMCANKVKVECHVALKESSQMISFGEIDVSEAIYKPNTKCKYKVALDGPNNMTAVISCWFKFECPKALLRDVLEK